MPTHCVVRQPCGGFHALYTKPDGLYYRTGPRAPEECVLINARLRFNAFLDPADDLHVFARDTAGETYLLTRRDGAWGRRTVFGKDAEDILITALYGTHRNGLLYNIRQNGAGCLVRHATDAQGKWRPPETIDSYRPLHHDPYEVQRTSDDHAVLFYRGGLDGTLGYRELTAAQTGAFKPIYKGEGVVDASFLTTQDTLHVLLAVRKSFGGQWVYIRKDGEDFTAPQVLWETPGIGNVLLMMMEGRLHAFCMSGGRLYVTVYEGGRFTPVALYKSKFCAEPVKAAYLSRGEKENNLLTHQVYVDNNAPWDVQVLNL
jgi:hypothetical protein